MMGKRVLARLAFKHRRRDRLREGVTSGSTAFNQWTRETDVKLQENTPPIRRAIESRTERKRFSTYPRNGLFVDHRRTERIEPLRLFFIQHVPQQPTHSTHQHRTTSLNANACRAPCSPPMTRRRRRRAKGKRKEEKQEEKEGGEAEEERRSRRRSRRKDEGEEKKKVGAEPTKSPPSASSPAQQSPRPHPRPSHSLHLLLPPHHRLRSPGRARGSRCRRRRRLRRVRA